MIYLQILCSHFKRKQTHKIAKDEQKSNQSVRQLRANQRRLENRGLSED
jgi:hypothetical protein